MDPTYTVFAGPRRLARGPLADVLRKTKRRLDANPALQVLIFEDATGRQVDFDFRGTADEVVARAAPPAPTPPAPAGPGRPKLGVIAREVSLLPRHWDWLERQPSGASAALRRLVEEATKREPDAERARQARAAVSRFMWVMAGDLPGFEEASRALFAGDTRRFAALVRPWPGDVVTHLRALLAEGGVGGGAALRSTAARPEPAPRRGSSARGRPRPGAGGRGEATDGRGRSRAGRSPRSNKPG